MVITIRTALLVVNTVLNLMDGEGVSNDSFDMRSSAVCRDSIRLAYFGNRSLAIGFV